MNPECQKQNVATSPDVIRWPFGQLVYDPTGLSSDVPYLIFGQSDGQTPVNFPSLPYDIIGMSGIGIDLALANPNNVELDAITVKVEVSVDGLQWTALDIVPPLDGLVGDGETRHIELSIHSRYLRLFAHTLTGTTDMDLTLTAYITEGE
jgi:hypothetical protein